MRIKAASNAAGSRAILARVVEAGPRAGQPIEATAARAATVTVTDLGMELRAQPGAGDRRIHIELGAPRFHGELGRLDDSRAEALQTIAAVRGYTAELHAYAHESQRVGRLLDLKA